MQMLSGLLLLSALLLQQKITEADPPCEITLPQSYKADPEHPRQFLRSAGREEWAQIRLTQVPAGGLLPQTPAGISQVDAVLLANLPANASFTFKTRPWGEFQTGIFEYRGVSRNLRMFGLRAVIPLKSKALLLTLEGADPLEQDIRSDFTLILDAVKGESNWLDAATLKRLRLAKVLDRVGLGLVGLYLVVWAAAFRESFMYCHGLRTVWLFAAAIALIIPPTLRSDIEVVHLVINVALPLALFGMAGRRVKLAIDLG